MRSLRTIPLVALLAAVACGDDDGTGPAPATLAGTWQATKVEYVLVANPNTRIDLVQLGGTATLVLESAGAFTAVSTFPGEPPFTSAGTWSASADVLTLSFISGQFGTWQFDMTLSGNTLTLSGADADFDVDDDGQDDPAKLNLVLVRG